MQHIIFEGAELAGKSWLMSRVYDYLESKYNKNRVILDGCHWFNCDVGVFGTHHGQPIIKHYLQILKELENKNLLLEKFHLSDIVYNRLHLKEKIDYKIIEKELLKLNFKIILVIFPEDKNILKKRIVDRLKLYPHYERILRSPEWYIKQQKEYLKEIKKTKIPYLVVETKKLPDENLIQEILSWMGEK
jgi:thymidylate kinase